MRALEIIQGLMGLSIPIQKGRKELCRCLIWNQPRSVAMKKDFMQESIGIRKVRNILFVRKNGSIGTQHGKYLNNSIMVAGWTVRNYCLSWCTYAPLNSKGEKRL